MKFKKMHGLGNDFILINAIENDIPDPSALAKRLCRRKFGIGADGLILICESQVADARMRIFNSDGSEPEMCGNGIRCFGKYLYDTGLSRKERLSVETLAGILYIDLTVENGVAVSARVDMGEPILTPAQIPVAAETNRVTVELGGKDVDFFCVSMGNPHAVTFDIYPEGDEFLRFGAYMEKHPLFPAKANIEFCRVEENGDISVRVWERGDGPTLACGTGSCAVMTAAHALGLTGRSAAIHLPGGTLHDALSDNGHVFMTGPAETVCSGEFEL